MEGIQLPHDVFGPHDALRHGLPVFKNDVLTVHPVEVIQRTAQTKRTLRERANGSAFPMKMDIERQILTRFQRPTGLIPSSMLGLESLTRELEEFGFEDFLNDPRESDTFVLLDLHEGMEVRLSLSKGTRFMLVLWILNGAAYDDFRSLELLQIIASNCSSSFIKLHLMYIRLNVNRILFLFLCLLCCKPSVV